MRRRVAVALAAATVLSGCTSSPTTPTAETATAAPTTERAAASGPNDAGAVLPSPLPYPTDDTASTDAALDAATAAMAAFTDRTADPSAWWQRLSPLLSTTAQAAYAGTDPLEVPAAGVTGPAAALDSPSSYLATIAVPTDVGPYQVLLSREGAGASWLVERLTPPDGLPAS